MFPTIGHVSALTTPGNGVFNCLMSLSGFLFPFADQRKRIALFGEGESGLEGNITPTAGWAVSPLESPERILPTYLEKVKVSIHRLSHPEVTHFTQTGALDVKAGGQNVPAPCQ